MKKINIADAVGNALMWLVAKCEGEGVSAVIVDGKPQVWLNEDIYEYRDQACYKTKDGKPRFLVDGKAPVGLGGNPIEVRQELCGTIMDREFISTLYRPDRKVWWACISDPGEEETTGHDGTTRIEAAMRCYVSSKMGDKVKVPVCLL